MTEKKLIFRICFNSILLFITIILGGVYLPKIFGLDSEIVFVLLPAAIITFFCVVLLLARKLSKSVNSYYNFLKDRT